MKRDMNFFAATMRYQTIHGYVSDPHAVVSCTQCHEMLLAMNLEAHNSSHVSGGAHDPTVHQEVSNAESYVS